MREMIDSGVKWIGRIPSTWKVIRGKYILEYLQKPVRETDEVITCFRDGEVTLRSNRREDGFTISMKEIGYQGIDAGDLVVHGMDGFAGAIGISDSRGKASPVLNVLGTNQNKRFMMYYLRNMAYSNIFMALSMGIRVRSCDLNWKKLGELLYPVPCIDEQNKIANFIDNRLHKISELHKNIQSQIDTLENYKKSVITKAVTKGLNPDAPMKDSGIEWMGKIPEHWLTIKLKYLGNTKNGLTYKPENIVEASGGKLVLRSSNIQQGKIVYHPDDVYVNSKDTSSIIEQNDILLCARNGSRDLIGKNAIMLDSIDAYYGAFMMVYRCSNPQYIHYVLNSNIFDHYLGTFFTSTINQLTKRNFENMVVPYTTSDEEQKEIVDYLKNRCVAIDNLIAKKRAQISTLQTYKKSLIYEYVTGKKEVPSDE